ncbi:MAG: glycosyltransferase family 87 protein [Pseudomonadota bacterium]
MQTNTSLEPQGRAPPSAKEWVLTALVSVIWIGLATVVFSKASGDDLASVYLAAVFHGLDRPDLIYDHHPEHFSDILSDEWREQGVARGHKTPDLLHPYVQPPLWSALLAPIALSLSFPAFQMIALAIANTCLVLCALVAWRLWRPDASPVKHMILSLVLLSFSWPYFTSMLLGQIQPVVTLLMLLALERAAAGRPGQGGLALATAAALKVSPAALGLYWLATGQWRAAGWAAVWGIAWLGLMVAIVDWALIEAFLDRLQGMSGQVVLGTMNISLPVALYWMTDPAPLDYTIRVAPAWFGPLTGILLVALMLIAANAERRADPARERLIGLPIALLGSLVLAPLAWAHYFTIAVLFLPALPRLIGRRWGLAVGSVAWLLVSAPLALLCAGEDTVPRTATVYALLPLSGVLIIMGAGLTARLKTR